MSKEFMERSHILNINVGILGHVDSGKTSLVKALSTSLSTAALDKNPQSQQRGITLDLGFSAFTLPMPEHLIVTGADNGFDTIQFTLVDCPGHASLIRTIIGGAQIIDMIVLVVDANKGIQTQTAECIVIGEITTDHMIIVMNKIDMLPENERDIRIARMTKKIRKIFSATKFANVPIIPIAAAVGGEKVAAVGPGTTGSSGNKHKVQGSGGAAASTAAATAASSEGGAPVPPPLSSGIDDLVELIKSTVRLPVRNVSAPFYYSIDHCFAIKGHGTVLTGTVLSGSIALNQMLEIPHMQVQRKVKSLQMFRKPVKVARQGDRVGICVTNLDPNSIERSIAAAPGSVPLLSSVICMVKKVRFFRMPCRSNSKYHVSIGHTTILATALFFGARELAALLQKQNTEESIAAASGVVESSDATAPTVATMTTTIKTTGKSGAMTATVPNKQSTLNATYQKNFPDIEYPSYSSNRGSSSSSGGDSATESVSDFLYQDEIVGPGDGNLQYGGEPVQWVLLQFQQPVFCPIGSLVIGSRLDADVKEVSEASSAATAGGGAGTTPGTAASAQCRLAFYGPVRESLIEEEFPDRVRVYTLRTKECEVFRLVDVRNGLSFEIIGWKLVSDNGSMLAFTGMRVETETGAVGIIVGSYGSGGKFRVKFPQGARVVAGGKLVLRFKRYIYDKTKRMSQAGLFAGTAAAAGVGVTSTDAAATSSLLSEGLSPNESEAHVDTTATASSDPSAQLPLELSQLELQTFDPREGGTNATKKTKGGGTKTVSSKALEPRVAFESTTAPSTAAASGGLVVSSGSEKAKPLSPPPVVKAPSEASSAEVITGNRDDKSSTVIPVSAAAATAVTATAATSVGDAASGVFAQMRRGVIESVKPSPENPQQMQAIVNGAFKMEENIKLFTGAAVYSKKSQSQPVGQLIGSFGKLGKCKILFNNSSSSSDVGDVVFIDTNRVC